MNDFTLGELKEIKSCVYFEGYRTDGQENSNINLLKKLDEIINNYKPKANYGSYGESHGE